MTDNLLVLNAGSSSIKFSIFAASETLPKIVSGQVSRIGQSPVYEGSLGTKIGLSVPDSASHQEVVEWLVDYLVTENPGIKFVAAGHRVVHGGEAFTAPVVIDEGVLGALSNLIGLAPNHQPHNLAGINALKARFPELPQFGCFDTSFHRTQPRVAQLFPLTRALADEGVIRYGFHGLSYAYISSILPNYLGDLADGRVLILHLGHGCSLCALKNGKSVATTMGFTSLGGLMMGKRSGDIDPGIILHCLRDKKLSWSEIEKLLNHQSGLLGMSGESDDVRDLLSSNSPNAREAIELFVYRIVQFMGSLIAVLEGLDAIVFTAGIGENSPIIRKQIMSKFSWLGAQLDDERNERNDTVISSNESAISVLQIPTDEERMIAQDTFRMLQTLKV